MSFKKYYSITILICCSFIGQAQLAKGDFYYQKELYQKAIPYYKKAVKSKFSAEKQQANIKLGNIYLKLNDYANAELVFRQAIEITDGAVLENDVYYKYAQVLKSNTKYEEAAKYYNLYLQKAPDDAYAKKALKFCAEIKYYLARPVEYSVKNVETINTEKTEFSPFVSKNKLLFAAEHEGFDFVNYEVNSSDGLPYIQMFVSEIEANKVKKSKIFSKKLSSDYHDGPACLSSDGKTLYFTRVLNNVKEDFVNRTKIYTAKSSNRSWKDITLLPFSSDDYSIAHPSISADNKTLFFTSDMPGGFGGKDIWMCVKNDSVNWGAPVNLGPDINTSGDEMFPSIRQDGRLFFSSNGLPGFGGLDIYSANKIDNKWILNRNEGIQINGSTDDFGVFFMDDSTGYFSSNRTGGKGKDDIYFFTFRDKSTQLGGTVLLSKNLKDVATEKKVILYDENGSKIDSTITDKKGNFVFRNLPSEKKYIAVVDEVDAQMTGKKRYYLAQKDTVITGVSTKLPNGKFGFTNVSDDAVPLKDAEVQGVSFAGKFYSGDQANVAMKSVKVKIVNQAGEVLGETVTDENGNFTFRNIPGDQNFIVSIDDEDLHLPEGTKITLTNRSGKEMKSYVKTKEDFAFKILTSEKNVMSEMAADEDITFAGTLMSGDKASKVMKNVKVRILNQAGEVIGETTTNEYGAFAFRNIPGDKNFIVSIDEGDAQLPPGTRITITNKSGKEVKSIIKDKEETFDFKILGSDKNLIADMEADDASMVMGIYGYIYDQDNKPIANTHLTVKDEDGTNPRKIVTSPYGKFSFKNLSAEKNYIFEVDPNDPVMLGVKSIRIADSKGKVYRVIELISGIFTFKILEADKSAMGEFTVNDPWLNLSEGKKREMRIKAERELAAKKAAELVAKQEKELAEKTARALAELEKKNKEEAALEARRIREEAAKEAKRIKDTELAAKKEQARMEEEERLQREKEEEAAIDMQISTTIIENIYYAYGKYAVTDEAKIVLDKAYEVLKGNPKLELEISSHTDAQSSYGFNLNLSRKRFQAAVDYLVAKGISRERLKPIGYGETKIINKCFNNVECTDAEHAVNRRTEFKIIKAKKRPKK